MKKNVLMLINGFGIEQNGSYNIYSPNLMPSLDKLTKSKIFSTITNNFLEYKAAYRNFSMGIDEALTYTLIDNNMNSVEYENNALLKYIINELNRNGSNLHLICYWDSPRVLEQLIVYVKEIEKKIDTKIFLNFVLSQQSVNDYNALKEGLNKLVFEFGQRVKICFITGEKNMLDTVKVKDVVKSFMTEACEKWKDLSKRIDVYVQNKEKPYTARSFAVNYGFRFEEKDQVLFFNYYDANITNFMNELKVQKFRNFDLSTLSFYSLFPLTSTEKVPFMYNYALSSDNFLSSLKKINARCLILEDKDRCSLINYYLMGLRNEVDEHLKFIPVDDTILFDESRLMNVFTKFDKELYIISYDIDSCKTVEELKNRLRNIDVFVEKINNYCKANNMGFFLSSMYGLETEMYNQKSELCKINFNSKVPLIIDDDAINLNDYSINVGKLYDLSNTLLFNINNDYDNSGLLKKKSKLFSIFTKKKVVNNSQPTNVTKENSNEQKTNV